MSSELSVLLFLIFGAVIGAVVTWFFMKTRFAGSLKFMESEKAQLHTQLQQQQQAITERDQLRLESGNLQAQLNSKLETQQDLNNRLDKLENQYIEVNKEKNNLEVLLAQQRTSSEKANEKHAEAQQEIEKLNEKFTKEFENLANKILDEKSTKFTDQNKKNIEQILHPLQEKILMFEKRVEDTHKDTIDRQSSLKQQILGLKELNQQMSKETTNLTKALKGDAKMRGNWGELILERVLEKSGLIKGSEYEVQQSFRTEDGKTLFPDVIINLPGDKKMIIDSKVSLNAYERYVNEEDEIAQDSHLKDHINALKKHVNDLSSKNYQNLYRIESPDFVLLFIPIEPAFAIALNNDSSLYNDAFQKNIIIVTPTTLLATLRTIDSMWKNEKQKKNSMNIANEAAKLYDQFVLLTDELLKLGKQLQTVEGTYTATMKKLTGKGNLIGKVERLKKLGVDASKDINRDLLKRTEANDPEFLENSNESSLLDI